MKKIEVPDQLLDKIFAMRSAGYSWVRIEHDTGVPRRAAKREYDDNQGTRANADLKLARQQVASSQFETHMRDLVSLAHLLLENMHDPAFNITTRADQLIREAFSYTNVRAKKEELLHREPINIEVNKTIRQNTLLFDSLKAHTREVVSWEIIEEWKNARDKWSECWAELGAMLPSMIKEISSQILIDISKISKDEMVLIKKGALEAIYHALIDKRLGEVEDYIRLNKNEPGFSILFNRNESMVTMQRTDQSSGKTVLNLAREIASTLSDESPVKEMVKALYAMREKRAKLDDMLDELRLIPLILRTRCEICPA